ncbi:MAG TPA: MauE/DoxX family redox-associated membrane protein [Candidatus Hydrogenedentes bacterium]|nr:MauE/DoxX family redox-associated membrane protein [Candidatus Hydrogenedentota bacterium]HPG65323.1 MauE/DoxX family redox-associated membrane protein [Candidatus Hydrogenedentota bacterium]
MSAAVKQIPRLTRLAEVLLGLVFLAGAILKAHDINLFTIQIRAYGLFEAPMLLAGSALGALAVETALAVAFLTGLRLRGLAFLAVSGLLVVFTALIAYGWIFHDLEDCGCFGPIEISPGPSILKNAIFEALAFLVWWTTRGNREIVSTQRGAAWAKAAACIVLAGSLVAWAWTNLEPVDAGNHSEDAPFAQFRFEDGGEVITLDKGEYFVVLYNSTCEHCMATVEPVNQFAALEGFPRVVAICYEDEPGTLDEFRQLTQPVFPLLSLGDQVRLFFSLVGDVPPRFAFVKDGRQLAFWDEEPPTADEVFRARAAASNPQRN